ncbi:hypothetical protein Ae201684P_018126 [Aphanomyces euteiches]|nr:hypothetical protein Ae201684P_018126 [Aphanomyces euteiches]
MAMDGTDGQSNGAASMRKMLLTKQQLQHNGNNPSIVEAPMPDQGTPWTPKSLGRAKSAIIYRQTLNDNLLFLERNMFYFQEWRSRFVSLQEDHMLVYASREKWEQGMTPDMVIRLNPMMFLSNLRVEVQEESYDSDGNGPFITRLFRRKLMETDQLDQWINGELRQSPIVGDSGSNTDIAIANNPEASARAVLEFATNNQHTFELWSKCLRRALQLVKQQDTMDNQDGSRSASSWVSPGHDCRVTLHQSEVWCSRVLEDDKEKAESELRRLIAMEKLVAQVTGPSMALLVYEKVSRVHELFAANSRREMEHKLVTTESSSATPLSPEILQFFGDHLKRKYAVFLMLALAYGISEDSIRDAHERMCHENDAQHAGVGGGDGSVDEENREYGFHDEASVELYDKYRTAASNYYKMNFGDPNAAEEEDAIMHLPVMLHIAIVRQDQEEMRAMANILQTVKHRLLQHIDASGNNESTT